MCGILGFNWEDKILLEKGLRKISHRGPDGEGIYIDKEVSLGHKRLSILDLSSAGKQPMSNEDGTIWIIFNGEIYNHIDLKNKLKKKHNFKSNTDTEILLHLYEEYGVDFLSSLIGMFAFCIYDLKKKILFLARDRLGIKPLYYYKSSKNFIFCSEIKGLLESDIIKKRVNTNALNYYLTFRANTSHETFFSGVMKLKPGHYAIYGLDNNFFSEEKFWSLNSFLKDKDSESLILKKLDNLLNNSVKLRLISDVPYGAYLSGGVDSGIIVSLMNKYSTKSIQTFSVGFEEEKTSELTEARFLSEKIGTDHHELWINKNSIKVLPEVIYHLDEPMSDPTSIPIYLLSKFTKKYSTVILTGEGSDEIFAGYPQYKFMKLDKKIINPFPKLLKSTVNGINFIPNNLLDKGFRFASSLGDKGKERLNQFILSNNSSEKYLNLVGIFSEDEKKQILNKKFKSIIPEIQKKYFKRSSNLLTSCQLLDLKGNLVEDLLMKLDKNTMAFAIEGRVPFLDHRIVEFAFNIPENMKLKNFIHDKYILRKAFRKNVPKQTLTRKKRHFFVPIDDWYLNDLYAIKKDLFSKDFIDKQYIFNYNYIENINKAFERSKLYYSRQIWSLLCFQIWYKQYILEEKILL